MSKVCETNTKADRARRDVAPGQSGGHATSSSATSESRRGLVLGLFATIAITGLLAGHAITPRDAAAHDGNLTVGLGNVPALVSRRDAQLTRGRKGCLGAGSVIMAGVEPTLDPGEPIDVYQCRSSLNCQSSFRPGRRVGPGRLQILAGLVVGRSAGHAGPVQPRTYALTLRAPIGSNSDGCPIHRVGLSPGLRRTNTVRTAASVGSTPTTPED